MKPFSAVMLAATLLPATLIYAGQARAQIGISVALPGVELRADIEPPLLPEYVQPPVPEPGYLWTPGYWGFGPEGYYWVPGTWVEPPTVGFLWTPGYWGFNDGAYVFNEGYWGPHVGFYGGVDYGFGYGGTAYSGGRWSGGNFEYNRSVTNVNTTVIRNTYNERVENRGTTNHVSFNGGPNGVRAAATPAELSARQEHHVPATPAQQQHLQQASHNRDLLASVNKGHPAIAATPRPGQFNGPGVVTARGGAATAPRAEGGTAGDRTRVAERATARPAAPKAEAPRAAAPRPKEAAPRAAAAPRAESAPRAEAAPRAQASPRPEAAPRPEARETAPRAAAPRPAAPPHESAPRAPPHAAARPESAPREEKK